MARDLYPHIRWIIRRDYRENGSVIEIENESFEFPWSEQDFIGCLRYVNCIGMVAEHSECVFGYMICELQECSVRLLTLAVDPDQRRRGVGSRMIKHLVGKLSLKCRSRITLEVRETNLAAQLFFRSCGFVVPSVFVLRDFYDETGEDAYLMEYQYKPGKVQSLANQAFSLFR